MHAINAKYVVDEKGSKTVVLLDITEYRKLLEYIEEVEDALDLKEAIESAEGFTDFDDFVDALKQEKRL